MFLQSGLEFKTSADHALIYSYNRPYSGATKFQKLFARVIGDFLRNVPAPDEHLIERSGNPRPVVHYPHYPAHSQLGSKYRSASPSYGRRVTSQWLIRGA